MENINGDTLMNFDTFDWSTPRIFASAFWVIFGLTFASSARSVSFCGSVKSRPRCFLGIFAEYARTT